MPRTIRSNTSLDMYGRRTRWSAGVDLDKVRIEEKPVAVMRQAGFRAVPHKVNTLSRFWRWFVAH